MTERFHRTFEAGQTAVVTGAALGIGRALARDLAARGMRVFAVDVDEAELAKTAAEADGAITAVVADVSDYARMKALADQTGPIRFLANNAVTRLGRGFDAPLDTWRQAVCGPSCVGQPLSNAINAVVHGEPRISRSRA